MLWTSLAADPRLPDRDSHHELLGNMENLYRAVHLVVSPEIVPVTLLDHSVVEMIRIFVVEHLTHIARVLGK